MLVIHTTGGRDHVELVVTAKDGSTETIRVHVSRSLAGGQAWLAFDADKESVRIVKKTTKEISNVRKT